MKRKLFIIILILLSLQFLFRIYQYRDYYLVKFNPEYWKMRYLHSQWVVPNSKESIGDDGLYAHVSWEYIQGRDPTTLNAELPPFGKYLIGLSELIFKNQNIFAILSGIFALVSFYFLNTLLFKNKLLAILPVFLFSLEPLFYTQLKTALLDLLYLGLLCSTFYFFLKKQAIRSGIFLGLMAATKSAASTFPLVIGSSFLFLLVTKQFKLIKKYFISIPAAAIFFLATYFQFFIQGHTFLEFLSVQKWIINFYATGAKGSLTAPYEIIFTGKYANWWGSTSVVNEWHIGWIILLLLSTVAIFFILKDHPKNALILISIWTVCYLLFLSFVPVWSRYFLLLLPFMYTLSIWLISQILQKHETT